MSSDSFLMPDEVRKEALKRLVLLLVGPLAFYIYESQNLPAKYSELNAKNQALVELQNYNAKQAASVAEIKRFKEDEALIEARIAALEKISKDRQREIRVLDLSAISDSRKSLADPRTNKSRACEHSRSGFE